MFKTKKEPKSLNQLVRISSSENHYKSLIAALNEPIILEQKWGTGDFDNLRTVFIKKQLVGIHAFRQLIKTTAAVNNNCELDTFQLQLFVEESINSFLSFLTQTKLSYEDIAKGMSHGVAFRQLISAWQYDFKKLGEIISKSYLSAVMRICCTKMPATHRDFTVFHLLTEVTLCERVYVKSHERRECISRLNMLYKTGVFPTLRIPIKTIIARLFDMMGLSPAAMQFPLRDPMPAKCVAYNLEDNKENLVKCCDMEFKTALEGGKDLLVEKAHLSVDSRVITIIPEKVESFEAVQVTIEPEMILKAAVKLQDKYVFTLDISVDLFCEEPWSTLGKNVTFCIDADESMEMFEKHAKIWKWKIPKKTEKTVVKSEAKTNVKTRKLANNSPDSMSTLGSVQQQAWKKTSLSSQTPTTLVDAAPKELPKKRTKSRGKLAKPSQMTMLTDGRAREILYRR